MDLSSVISGEIDRIVSLCKVGQTDAALRILRDHFESRGSLLSRQSPAQICFKISSDLDRLGKLECGLRFLYLALTMPITPEDVSFVRHALGVHYHKRGLLHLAASNLKLSIESCNHISYSVPREDLARTLVSLATVLGEIGRNGDALVVAADANKWLLSASVPDDIRAAAELVLLRQRVICSTPVVDCRRVALKHFVSRGYRDFENHSIIDKTHEPHIFGLSIPTSSETTSGSSQRHRGSKGAEYTWLTTTKHERFEKHREAATGIYRTQSQQEDSRIGAGSSQSQNHWRK